MARRALYVHRGTPDLIPALAPWLEQAGYVVDALAVETKAPLRGIPRILFAARRFASYDLIAATEYNLGWALSIRLWVERARSVLVVLGFNQSGRLLLSRIPAIDRLLNRIWRRVAVFVVHSGEEARQFERVHDIPAERFAFAHWGYDLPPIGDPGPTPVRPYVSMIGRNNRDVATFCAATRRAGIDGIIVTSAYVMRELAVPIPDTVQVRLDIPMEECLRIVARSAIHLVLVLDGLRGAGHISAVSAMLLDKPQIFSDVATLREYLIDGHNGLAVPLGDDEAVAAAITRLCDDPALAARLGVRGHALATSWMSNEASMGRMAAILIAAADRQPPPTDAWPAGRARLIEERAVGAV